MQKLLAACCLAVILGGTLCLQQTFNTMRANELQADASTPFIRDCTWTTGVKEISCGSRPIIHCYAPSCSLTMENAVMYNPAVVSYIDERQSEQQ